MGAARGGSRVARVVVMGAGNSSFFICVTRQAATPPMPRQKMSTVTTTARVRPWRMRIDGSVGCMARIGGSIAIAAAAAEVVDPLTGAGGEAGAGRLAAGATGGTALPPSGRRMVGGSGSSSKSEMVGGGSAGELGLAPSGGARGRAWAGGAVGVAAGTLRTLSISASESSMALDGSAGAAGPAAWRPRSPAASSRCARASASVATGWGARWERAARGARASPAPAAAPYEAAGGRPRR